MKVYLLVCDLPRTQDAHQAIASALQLRSAGEGCDDPMLVAGSTWLVSTLSKPADIQAGILNAGSSFCLLTDVTTAGIFVTGKDAVRSWLRRNGRT